MKKQVAHEDEKISSKSRKSPYFVKRKLKSIFHQQRHSKWVSKLLELQSVKSFDYESDLIAVEAK